MNDDTTKAAARPPAGQEKIEQAALLLVQYFQCIGARTGLLLSGNQQAEIASIAVLLADAAVERALARTVADAASLALKKIDAAVEVHLVKIAESAKKAGAK